MARGRKSRGAPPFDTHQANKDKRERLARLQSGRGAKVSTAPQVQVTTTADAVAYDPAQIEFLLSGSLEPARLAVGVSRAVGVLRDVVRTGKSNVLLAWPAPLPGAAMLHAVSVLCELAEGPGTYRGLTTAFYPASARTGANQKNLLVNREWLLAANRPWLNTYLPNLKLAARGVAYTQARFHYMLSRVGDLSPGSLKEFQRAQSVVQRAHDRGHPTLHELTARRVLRPSGELIDPGSLFLDRSWKLSKLLARRTDFAEGQRVEAVDAMNTPWLVSLVHGASPPASWTKVTASKNRKPDVLLIDLQRRARARLGENWKAKVSNAIARMRNGDMDLPMLVITDDPFVAGFARREFAAEPKGRARKKLWPVTFTEMSSEHVLAQPSDRHTATGRANQIVNLNIEIFGSDVARLASDAMQLRSSVIKLADGEIARAISVCVSRLRAMANAPMSQGNVSQIFLGEEDSHTGRRLLAAYDIGAAIADLKSVAARADKYEGEIDNLIERIRALAVTLSTAADTTTRPLFKKRFTELTKRATRTLVVAPSGSAAQLLEAWIEDDPDLQSVAERLGEKFEIVAPKDARARVATAAQSTKPFARILLLSPPPWACLALAADRNCPQHIDVLADGSTGKFVSDYGRALLRHWKEESDARGRVAKMVDALVSALDGQVADLPDFDLSDASANVSTVTDLTRQTGKPGSQIFKIITVDGEEVLANPETIFVTRRVADLQQFEYVTGKRLTVGREILVPSQAFLEQVFSAREFRAAALPLLTNYHDAVRERARDLKGQTVREKAQLLLKAMDLEPADRPTLTSIERWLSVDRQAGIPAELRVPQAPRKWTHFVAFTDALELDRTMAKIFWPYAILATRGLRIRSGFKMRKLYMSALIAPDAMVRTNPAASALVKFVQDIADQHISEVASIDRHKEKIR